MTDTLKVIKPFFVMEAGDMFERTETGAYRSEYNNESELTNAKFENSDLRCSYKSSFEISNDYAEALLSEGYLEEIKDKTPFVNVFDEIEKLAMQYDKELDDIEESMKDMPQCMKVEKETVLRNMLKVLEHLHSLKK